MEVEHNRITGKPRLRCLGCGKVAYPVESEAKAARDKIKNFGTKMRYYFDPECGWWHLTRKDADQT